MSWPLSLSRVCRASPVLSGTHANTHSQKPRLTFHVPRGLQSLCWSRRPRHPVPACLTGRSLHRRLPSTPTFILDQSPLLWVPALLTFCFIFSPDSVRQLSRAIPAPGVQSPALSALAVSPHGFLCSSLCLFIYHMFIKPLLLCIRHCSRYWGHLGSRHRLAHSTQVRLWGGGGTAPWQWVWPEPRVLGTLGGKLAEEVQASRATKTNSEI